VTPDGVTGFCVQSERLQKPSARSVGHTWARSASRGLCCELNKMLPDLHKHEAGYIAGTREVDQWYMALWARREPGPKVTDIWRTA